jgi:arsenite methyltransferase
MANYGIDHPKVVLNLMVGGSSLLATTLVLHKRPEWVHELFSSQESLQVLKIFAGSIGTFLVTEGILMIISSKFTKVRQAKKLVDELNLNGDEIVLDVGCSSGVLLTQVGKKLTTGTVYGVDRWNERSNEQIVLQNCKAEGIERVKIMTADLKETLPFGDNYFDCIVSNSVIHNMNRKARSNAFSELLRVLKSRGTLVIQDVKYTDEYEKELKRNADLTVSRSSIQYMVFPPAWIVTAVKNS